MNQLNSDAHENEEHDGLIDEEEQKPPLVLPWWLVVAIVVILAFGVSSGTMVPLYYWVKSAEWVETPCTILESGYTTHTNTDDEDRYFVNVKYRYTFDGREYESAQLDLLNAAVWDEGLAQRWAERFPEGESTTCYVNPDNPGQAILVRDFQPSYLLGLGGIPMAALLLYFDRNMRRRHKAWLEEHGPTQ